MKNYSLFIISIIISLSANGQKFKEIVTPFKQLEYAHVKNGDFNNDGYYDCIICGSNDSYIMECYLYKNKGNFDFEEIPVDFEGVSGRIDCRDYDSDGDLDVLISGIKKNSYGAKKYTYLYNNLGDFNFENSNAFADSIYIDPLWIDYDNDGDEDISCYNVNSSKYVILENMDNSSFVETVELPQEANYWYDFDKDGFKDYVSYGGTLFKNHIDAYEKVQCLTDTLGSNYKYSRQPYLFNDFNVDGTVDILVARGANDHLPQIHQSHVFINDTSLFDSIAYDGFIGITSQGELQTVDVENDGDLDVFISGCCNEDKANFYRNDSLWHYTSVPFFLNTIYNTSSEWADIDNDNDLDILIAGSDYNRIVKIFENDTTITNTSPSKPTNLTVDVDSCFTMFSWDKSTDLETPINGISYNIYIGTHADSMNIVSSNSNRESGKLLFPHIGNCGLNTHYIIRDLDTSKTYYWGVQSIDYLYQTSDYTMTTYTPSDEIVDSINLIQKTSQDQFSIFPNPTNSTITIKINENSNINKFDVISIEGKLLATYFKNNELIHKIDLPQKGIFIMRFYLRDEVLIKKIIRN